ncbi:ABC transporter ATP-binding protein [Thermasporomyces composti]|uniref:ABC transporter ATP-binding protein n=1 Tax=Thermasporomyces composti TaxID=696763 RepID=UPI000E231192|nr:ABC transporter ATP-binding protein [Thermasporomyces composti]
MFSGLVFDVRRGLLVLLGSSSALLESTLQVRPFIDVMAYQDDGPKPSRTSREETPSATRPPVRRDDGLVLDNVSFSYPGRAEPALKDVSLRIGSGEIVLVVGEDGAGKTTLAKLICRLYDPSAGRILWNGTDYRDIPLAELRRNISVVFHDYARFPTTLRENDAARERGRRIGRPA